MRYGVKFFTNLTLLLTILSFVFYPQTQLSAVYIPNVPPQVSDFPYLTYDGLLQLFDEIESGELEKKCTVEDLKKITRLLAFLAEQGMLSEDDYELKQDIQELLDGLNELEEEDFVLDEESTYSVIPSLLHDQWAIVLCKRGWFHKRWDHIKSFAKKHKKPLIIGTAIAVGVVAVVGIVALASSAGAAAAASAAGAAAAAASSDDEKSSSPEIAEEAPLLTEVLEEQVFSLKENIAESSIHENDHSLGETAREFASFLAHKSLDQLSEVAAIFPQFADTIEEIGSRLGPGQIPDESHMEKWDQLVASGHEKIDGAFETNFADLYIPEAKINGIRGEIVDLVLPPPGNFSKGINAGRIKEALQQGREAAALAEELGFSSREIAKLEIKVDERINNIARDAIREKNPLYSFRDINFTEHALQRAVERGISQAAIFDALDFPLKIEPIKIDHLGRPSQRIIGRKAEVVINPETKQVVTVNPTSTKKAEKLMNELMNGEN